MIVLMFHYSDEYTFTLRLANGDGNTSSRRGLELSITTKELHANPRASPSVQPRTLHRLLIAVSPDVSYDDLLNFSWSDLDVLLSSARRLTSFQVLCGKNITQEQVDALTVDLPRMMPRSGVKIRHAANDEDPTILETDVFRREEWTSRASEVWRMDGMGSLLSKPKYVNL